MSDYDAFAHALLDGGLVGDPWFDGKPRFDPAPRALPRELARKLLRAGETLASILDAACALLDEDEGLLESFVGLSPLQRALWQASAPLWHGIARADVFLTHDGMAVTELNSDTPTGEPEAVELGRLARLAGHEGSDPNAKLEAHFVALAERLVEHWVQGPRTRVAALVYPTEFTEELSVVRLYRRWLEAAGWRVVLGSPYNLGRAPDGRATLFDEPVSLLLRHYKTDWWTERVSAWTDEELDDPSPLTEPLTHLLGACVDRRTAVLNPTGSIVAQNKRVMALLWEHLHRFAPEVQTAIQELVPYTVRLETLHPAQLLAQRAQWVLKSDYGAEGDEVVLGHLVDDATWQRTIERARPGHWVAQRYFEALVEDDGAVTNYGVFVVAGRAAGLYLRRHKGPTDASALSMGVLVQK